MHFVQSDVGLGCGIDSNGATLMWNKQYDAEAYNGVYRIKMKSARYNELLRWAVETVDACTSYDHAYMRLYCMFSCIRECMPISWSDSRQTRYTCASLTFSALAVAGLSDITDPGFASDLTRKQRAERKETMLRDRNVTVSDVLDILDGTMSSRYAKTSDVALVSKLKCVPHPLCRPVVSEQ